MLSKIAFEALSGTISDLDSSRKEPEIIINPDAETERGIRVAFVKEQLTVTGEDTPMAMLLLSVMGRSLSSSER
jgi:hypothetical protein